MKHAINTATHRRCNKCGGVKLLDEFPRSAAKPQGRHYHCRECRKVYDRRERRTPRVVEVQTPVPLPAMDLLQRLECRRLARWAKCVETNPRFGVAMIGGGYVC